MSRFEKSFLLHAVLLSLLVTAASASTRLDESAFKDVKRRAVQSDAEQRQLERAAMLLANYEIDAGKLVAQLDQADLSAATIRQDAIKLPGLSEEVIDSARFRLPQCQDYLAKTIAVREQLNNISHETLEKDYHHDGALPKAPPECYHTKDLFIHPATVVVLTRDDPALSGKTRGTIKAEINEVLAHTEAVRQLVFY